MLPLNGDKKPYPYVNSKATEGQAKLSPDGRWLAYRSNETGQPQVFVESFPEKGGKWQVSVDGGSRPVWSGDGKQLFFIAGQGTMMAAGIRAGAAGGDFDWSPPKPLFDAQLGMFDPGAYDVAPDGRFLLPQITARSASFSVTLVLDWHAALKK